MTIQARQGIALATVFAATLAWGQTGADDVILKAMRDELARSQSLGIAGLDRPYYLETWVEDADTVSITASLGALVTSNHTPVRVQRVRVRVGDYAFDNTNHVYSDYYTGSRYDPEQLPVENSYQAMRQVLWLATDRAYKAAEEAIARKRSSLKNVNAAEQLPDYSKATPVQAILPIHRTPVDETVWKARVTALSKIFAAHPEVLSSSLEFQSSQTTSYLANSEGTVVRTPDNVAYLRIRAHGQAPDGMLLHDAEVFQAFDAKALPPEAELRRGIAAVAEEMGALTRAPLGDGYSGPVLFDSQSAAQLFAQVLGDNLKVTRKPVPAPGRPAPHSPSELENKIGSKILPEWMDVVDDPTQTEWHGQTLFGHYTYDLEGVAPKPLPLIEKGVLKTFLLTRTPVLKGLGPSNGRARLQGAYGADAPGFGNLFVRASQTVSTAEIKRKLIDLCLKNNKPYGIIVRKLDYPSSASREEFRRATSAMAQSGGGTRPVSLPLLVYRVYPDGREELVRGLRFRGMSTRSFRDIIAASDEMHVFSFMDSFFPFALMGGNGFISNAAVIAPAVLFEELELERTQEDLPKLPVVPPPS
ncbi:MAG: metallopeptidase TldD-related protein [Acidobacteriota bacterium]|nr:metallopeptidase TldD-related protein [Acidobacteriota bacterium]